MIYLIMMLLGVIVGLLAKGRFANLANIRFDRSWLILTAFLIYAALAVAGSKLELNIAVLLSAQASVFCLLITGLWFNRRYFGVWLIAAGYFLNSLVIMLNGGKMPVSIDAVKRAGLLDQMQGDNMRHAIVNIDRGVRLPFLADIIHPPFFLGYGMQIVSIGDLVIALGLFLVIVQMMTGKWMEIKSGK